MANSKILWEEIAKNEAYFGVSTFEKYRSAELDEEARREFFETRNSAVNHAPEPPKRGDELAGRWCGAR